MKIIKEDNVFVLIDNKNDVTIQAGNTKTLFERYWISLRIIKSLDH